MKNHPLVLFIRLSRPLFLLGGVGMFVLGTGMARYLGHTVDWGIFTSGIFWVLAIHLASHYLNEYFDAPLDALNPGRTPFSGGSGVLGAGEDQLPRNVALVAAFGMFTIAAILTFSLMQAGQLNPAVIILMVLIFLGAFFYSVPPVQLVSSGYGELTTAVLVGALVPALAFALQAAELHRLLPLVTLPLVFLFLAVLMAVSFPDYATDQKYGKRTLLVRAGWENGMLMHNTFILFAFVLLGVAGLLGLPSAIVLPAFLPLPLGVLQVWYMRRIAAGAKPNWRALILNGVALCGTMAYLLTFVFWTR